MKYYWWQNEVSDNPWRHEWSWWRHQIFFCLPCFCNYPGQGESKPVSFEYFYSTVLVLNPVAEVEASLGLSFFRIDMLKGADNASLETKIKQYYTDASQDEETGVKGFVRTFD